MKKLCVPILLIVVFVSAYGLGVKDVFSVKTLISGEEVKTDLTNGKNQTVRHKAEEPKSTSQIAENKAEELQTTIQTSEIKTKELKSSSQTSEDKPKEVQSKNFLYQSGDEKVQAKANSLMANMSLDEKIWQMFFTTPESLTGIGTAIQAGESTKAALEKYPIGGIIYFAPNILNKEQITTMIANSQRFSRIPLFIGVDEEGGIVSRIGGNSQMGITKIQPMQEIGALNDENKAYQVGETIAGYIGDLGFNVDFAPVADVLINSQNQEIGSRSFGSDVQVVQRMVSQVVNGLENNGISACLKHFPGHGSTSVDSHTGYSESTRTLEEFRKAEFLPFQAGINSGVDFVMISNMTAINVTKEAIPCSLSKEIITNLLKNELGFKGIIITDSQSMGAITNKYTADNAAVKAIQAGADIILMPADLNLAYKGVKQALADGSLSEERINESVQKILTLKFRRGIITD